MSEGGEPLAAGGRDFANLNARELLILASTGNVDAQSAMADRMASVDLPDDLRLLSAEWWARIAATHRREKDVKRLVVLLCFLAGRQLGMGHPENGVTNAAEAIALCDELADNGCEDSAALLTQRKRGVRTAVYAAWAVG